MPAVLPARPPWPTPLLPNSREADITTRTKSTRPSPRSKIDPRLPLTTLALDTDAAAAVAAAELPIVAVPMLVVESRREEEGAMLSLVQMQSVGVVVVVAVAAAAAGVPVAWVGVPGVLPRGDWERILGPPKMKNQH
eukprot:scaffold23434_cov53-Attheya_sp.AAC.1